MRKSIKKLCAIASASVLALTVAVTAVPNTAGATNVSKAGKEAAKKAFDASGNTEYHAYFGMQQEKSWIFRDEWYAEENGVNGTKIPEGQKFEETVYKSGDNGNEVQSGKVYDAVIKGNGVYSVGVDGLAGILTQGETNDGGRMMMLYCDTDMPVAAKEKITISDLKLEIDGMEQTLPENVFFCEESETESGLLRFDPYNLYQKEQGAYPECPSIKTPNDSVKITFKVSGFDVDNPDAVEATPTPAADTASSASDSSSADNNGGGLSSGAVAGIVIAVVVVIAIIVVVVKRKND